MRADKTRHRMGDTARAGCPQYTPHDRFGVYNTKSCTSNIEYIVLETLALLGTSPKIYSTHTGSHPALR